MECKYAEKLMMKYMDGEISEEEASALNNHILSCESCKEKFFVYDAIITETEILSAEEIAAPAGFEKDVMMKIKAEKTAVYGYSRNDRIRIACVSVCGLLFASSYMLAVNRQTIISKMYQYPIFRPYLDKVVPFTNSMEVYAGHIITIVEDIVLQADRILSSMAIGIFALLVAFCALQAVVYMRKNRRR